MKSELIRLATLDPIGTARRIDLLEQQRDKLLNLCRAVQNGQEFNEAFCKVFDEVIAEIEAAE